jgi:hypothetical protein
VACDACRTRYETIRDEVTGKARIYCPESGEGIGWFYSPCEAFLAWRMKIRDHDRPRKREVRVFPAVRFPSKQGNI